MIYKKITGASGVFCIRKGMPYLGIPFMYEKVLR